MDLKILFSGFLEKTLDLSLRCQKWKSGQGGHGASQG